jgi:hypothetical protein
VRESAMEEIQDIEEVKEVQICYTMVCNLTP